jgi:iron-sulfur cluster assembly accessory protein
MTFCTLTPDAKQQISKLCQENNCYAVKLGVKGGGCAGFEYEWSTVQVDDINTTDKMIECDSGNFVIDSHSVMFLLGSEIDYKKDLMGSMFDIKNPNAQSSCGCGVSINFDLDNLPDLSSPAT